MRQASTRFPLLVLLIVLACLAIYRPGLDGPLLFDDKPALTANDLVKIDGATFDEWRTAALSSDSGMFKRPMAMATFAANHAIDGGFSPASLKATNLAIHLATAIVLYFLFGRVLQSLDIGRDERTRSLLALTGAAIWLLHPVNVSTVLYAVQRMAQLAAFCVLAGLLVFMHYRHRWRQVGPPAGEVVAAGLWLLLFTALAALCKENGLLLPWLIIALEVCIFRGVWAGRPIGSLRAMGWVLLIAPVFLVLAMMVWAPESLIGGYVRREFTLEERLLTQLRVLWRYLGWIALPNIYDMGFQHDDIPMSTGLFSPLTTVIALIGWLLLLLASILLRRRYPLLLLAVLFFLIGQSMESSVIPLEMVYEHRNYLPAVMLCLGLAWLLVVPASDSKRLSVWYPVLGALAILSLLLFVRVQSWSDELTLSRNNLAQHPESSRSNYFHANALLRQYRRASQSGFKASEADYSLLLSRHYFERMYQTNLRDVAALVMLYYLDSHYFRELQDQVDWLEKLEELLADRTLQPSDWNALAMLFDLVRSGSDVVEQERIMTLLDRLSRRFPRSTNVAQYRYQYLSALGAEPAQLLPPLLQVQERSPAQRWVYHALLREQIRSRDIAGMYESARLWLQHDPGRLSVNEIKSLFSATNQPSEASGG